jgi:hypothetical protein
LCFFGIYLLLYITINFYLFYSKSEHFLPPRRRKTKCNVDSFWIL